MKFGKRQLIIATLVVALGAAVYLNWQFSANDALVANGEAETSASKEIGEATYVNTKTESSKSESSKSSSKDSTSKDETSTTAVSAKVSKNEYFAQAELQRKQAQDEETELLEDIIQDSSKSDSAKAEAVKQAAEVAERIEQQSNIESLIKAKGFSECIAFISNDSCNVVVSKDSVTDAGAITIKDIVHSQSGIDFDKIKISEAE